jgi:hypothetical protein
LPLCAVLLLGACGSTPPARGPSLASAVLTAEQGRDVAIHALGLVGTPYRYGGNTPEGGFDCSGLIGYVFTHRAGVVPPRTVASLAGFGVPLPREALRTGDLVVFGADGETRVLEGRAAVHAASGRYLYVAHDPLFDPDVPIGTYAITRVDPTGGGPEEVVATGSLPTGGRVSDVAADGAAVAWVVSDGSRAAIYLIDGARRVVIHAPDPAGSARMSLSGGRLAWGEGSAGADGGTYLLDRDDTLWRLATSPGRSEAGVAGDWVAWAQVAEDGRSSAVQVARWLR